VALASYGRERHQALRFIRIGFLVMLDNQVDRLHTLIGRIATEFSSVEGLWYLIFTCLLPNTPRAAIDKIFDKFKSGRQQRELILSVAGAVLPVDSALLQSIKTHAKRTWNTADRRNDAIHSVIHVSHYTIPPTISATGISKRSDLADKDIPEEIADLYRTVAILELDMNVLRLDIMQFTDPGAQLQRDRQKLESARLMVLQKFETDQILRAVEGRP
jgi:hypothetical protein